MCSNPSTLAPSRKGGHAHAGLGRVALAAAGADPLSRGQAPGAVQAFGPHASRRHAKAVVHTLALDALQLRRPARPGQACLAQ